MRAISFGRVKKGYFQVVIGLIAACCILACKAQELEQRPEHPTGLLFDSQESLHAASHPPVYREFLPERVDLSGRFPAPGDQGEQGSCVAWAVGYAARSYYSEVAEGLNIADMQNIPSPAYIYNSTKAQGNCKDAGSSPISALKLLKTGSLSFKDYPPNNKCSPPTQSQIANATKFTIDDYNTILPDNLTDDQFLDQIKHQLKDGNPVIVAMDLTDDFFGLKGQQIYSRRTTCTRPHGCGHAMTIVAYDEIKQAFKLINSWGVSWGEHGFVWMKYTSFVWSVKAAYTMHVPSQSWKPTPTNDAPPTIISFKASPTTVKAGQSSRLSWFVTGASSIFIEPLIGKVDGNSILVRPDQTAYYTMTAYNSAGSATAKSSVSVSASTSIALPEGACGAINVDRHGDIPVVNGFVGDEKDLEKIRADAPGAVIKVDIRPFPQCEVLATLQRALSASDVPKVTIRRTHGDENLVEGDQLIFDVKSPSYPSFLHVAYIQADGSVLNLIQPGDGSFKIYPPRSHITVGDDPGFRRFHVSAPFGRETLIVIAAKSPVFPKIRPQRETEREFLTAVRRALLSLHDISAPEDKVSASYDAIVTTGRM